MTEEAQTSTAPAVCRTCRFGRGIDRACILLEQGDQRTLIEHGPCQIANVIQDETSRLIRRRYPFARSMAEDLASEVLLHVLEGENLLAPGQIFHLPVLERRIKDIVRNATIDALRHHRLVTRIRCGACVHFEADSPPPGCHLPFLPDLGTEAQPNPWYGSNVERTTDPRALDPRCDAFSWRRPDTHDIFAEEVPGMSAEGNPRERALSLLVGALDRLARQDETGMRAAAALFWHSLRGKSVSELAEEAQVSDKTIKRLLATARERLLEIMKTDFGVENLDQVL